MVATPVTMVTAEPVVVPGMQRSTGEILETSARWFGWPRTSSNYAARLKGRRRAPSVSSGTIRWPRSSETVSPWLRQGGTWWVGEVVMNGVGLRLWGLSN